MGMSRTQVLAADTVLRWVTGVARPGQPVPSTDEAAAAATVLALAARRANVLAATDGPVITAAQIADRWPDTPPPGERAAGIAAAVGAMRRLADDIAATTAPLEKFTGRELVDAVRTRADQIAGQVARIEPVPAVTP